MARARRCGRIASARSRGFLVLRALDASASRAWACGAGDGGEFDGAMRGEAGADDAARARMAARNGALAINCWHPKRCSTSAWNARDGAPGRGGDARGGQTTRGE